MVDIEIQPAPGGAEYRITVRNPQGQIVTVNTAGAFFDDGTIVPCRSAFELWRTRGLADDRGLCRFLAALNREGVGYVVIGGMAVLAHVPYRTTRDLDVLIEPTLENARRAQSAVRSWGGFEPDFAAAEFIEGDILSFGGLLRVEIHSRVPGATWEQIWSNRVRSEFRGVEPR